MWSSRRLLLGMLYIVAMSVLCFWVTIHCSNYAVEVASTLNGDILARSGEVTIAAAWATALGLTKTFFARQLQLSLPCILFPNRRCAFFVVCYWEWVPCLVFLVARHNETPIRWPRNLIYLKLEWPIAGPGTRAVPAIKNLDRTPD